MFPLQLKGYSSTRARNWIKCYFCYFFATFCVKALPPRESCDWPAQSVAENAKTPMATGVSTQPNPVTTITYFLIKPSLLRNLTRCHLLDMDKLTCRCVTVMSLFQFVLLLTACLLWIVLTWRKPSWKRASFTNRKINTFRHTAQMFEAAPFFCFWMETVAHSKAAHK